MSGFEPVIAEAAAAEIGTTALTSEVMASNALAAANAAAYTPSIAGSLASVPAGLGALASAVPGMYGVGTATTGALSGGIPTLAEQIATTNPEILSQVQTALKPALLEQPVVSGLTNTPLGGQLSGAELTNLTSGIPNATGSGVQVAGEFTKEMLPPDMLPSGGNVVKDALFNSVYGDTAGMVTPEKSPFEQLIDKSKYLTKAKDWFDKQDNEDLALYGAGAGLGLAALNRKKKELGVPSPYDGPLSRFKYDPDRYRAQELAQPSPYRASYAVGGTIEEMSNANAVGANTGYPMADIRPGAYATPYQQPISRNVLSDASDTGVDPMTGEMRFAFGGFSGSPTLGGPRTAVEPNKSGPKGPTLFSNLRNKKAPPPPTQFAVPPVAAAPVPAPTPYQAQYEQPVAPPPPVPAVQAQYVPPPPDQYQQQYQAGFQPQNQRALALASMGQSFVPPPPTQAPATPKFAQGGISDLGSYSDYARGGRMLKGPGDGMSDNIPATIAGRQPARLANEEFVIPADVVSHLGNGSSEAGAKQLYKMMDRIRQARTGQKKQGKQINPINYMPI